MTKPDEPMGFGAVIVWTFVVVFIAVAGAQLLGNVLGW